MKRKKTKDAKWRYWVELIEMIGKFKMLTTVRKKGTKEGGLTGVSSETTSAPLVHHDQLTLIATAITIEGAWEMGECAFGYLSRILSPVDCFDQCVIKSI